MKNFPSLFYFSSSKINCFEANVVDTMNEKKMLHNLAGNIWMCWCIEWEMELKKMNTKKSKTFFCITTWSNNLSSDKCQKVVRLWSLNYIKLEATLHLWSLYIFRECRRNTHIRKCSTKSSWTCLCTRIKIDTD